MMFYVRVILIKELEKREPASSRFSTKSPKDSEATVQRVTTRYNEKETRQRKREREREGGKRRQRRRRKIDEDGKGKTSEQEIRSSQSKGACHGTS